MSLVPVTVPKELRRLRAVVFDFDGVLLESSELKTEAFRELFSHLPEHQDAIVAYHLEHLGISRYEKFAWVYRELLGLPLDDGESQRLGQAYSELIAHKIATCPAVPGAPELLAALHGRWPAFVASGTPQDELRQIVEQRGWSGYFKGVWGSPRHKDAILLDILERFDLTREEVVMVGDGLTDYHAARAVGLPFIARVIPAMASRWETLEVPRVTNLHEIQALLEDGLNRYSAEGNGAPESLQTEHKGVRL